MAPGISDDQLDRAVADLLAERRAEIVASVMSARATARRHGPDRRAPAAIGQRLARVLLAALMVALLAGAAAIVGSALRREPAQLQSGVFTRTGSMTIARTGHTAMLLSDGRVVVIGGIGAAEPGGSYVELRSAEVWDPETGRFEPLPFLTDETDERVGYTATLLPDDRVLVAGGPIRQAVLWDPTTGELEPAGTMLTARSFQTATLLADGRVLLIGGWGEDGPAAEDSELAEAETWDPDDRSFTPAGTTTIRRPETATLLPDGRVLVVEGGPEGIADVWDPPTRTFDRAGFLSEGHPEHSATLLPDGRVLVVGGMATFPVELWDPATGSFEIVGRLDAETGGHTATLLPDGNLLVLGGYDVRLKWSYDTALLVKPPWEPFDRAALTEDRRSHSATLLPDGRVLIVGGASGRGRHDSGPSRPDEVLRTAELWSP